ncbi:MAG: formylglycine-generating enzyme family protein [Marinilabiliales bacterium]|nr:formylglycine-generating enzyme family protein [Marinilabiliales bacterium]
MTVRSWPWGRRSDFHATKCNNAFGMNPLLSMPSRREESPYGVADLVGNVWQMTADVYCNGAYWLFQYYQGGRPGFLQA